MQQKGISHVWARAALPEVGLVAAKWTAMRTGSFGSFWSAPPRWLGRYLGEISSAHAHSMPSKN